MSHANSCLAGRLETKKLGKAELTHMPAKLDALDNRCDEKVNCK